MGVVEVLQSLFAKHPTHWFVDSSQTGVFREHSPLQGAFEVELEPPFVLPPLVVPPFEALPEVPPLPPSSLAHAPNSLQACFVDMHAVEGTTAIKPRNASENNVRFFIASTYLERTVKQKTARMCFDNGNYI